MRSTAPRLATAPLLRTTLLACACLATAAMVAASAHAAAAAGPPGGPTAGPAGVRVTVLLYSGRRDPSFMLTDPTAIGQLKQLLEQASPDPAAAAQRQSVLPPILGYHGILVENPGAVGGLPRRLAVYKARVEARDGGATRFFSHGGALEGYLIDRALESKAVDGKAVELIRASLAAPEAKPR